MDFDQAREKVLSVLRAKGKARNSELIRTIDGDTALFEEIREDLILEDLAEDKKGVGLIYVGAEESEPVATREAHEMPRLDHPLRIFLSYGHDEHAEVAVRLKQDLLARGHEVWFDLDQLKPGSDWERYIEQGIEWAGRGQGTGRVVLLMTPHSVRRPDGYCLNEIARALDRHLPILPVMVVPVEPPISICRIQWLDMRDCIPLSQRFGLYSGRLDRLFKALEEGEINFEGAQARLTNLLEPLPFDADIQQHLARFTGRNWLIREIDQWLSKPTTSRCFWIVGPPGIGKTALSTWLCTHRREIAAFHLCRHGHDQKADPRHMIRSIAYQLASQLPEYQERLLALKDLDELIREANAQTLFDRLIVQPLHGGFPDPGRSIVVLIDGLDEATRDGTNEVARILGREFPKAPEWMKLILTSRPEHEVLEPLQGLEPRLIDADCAENMNDVRAYLERELQPFTEESRVPAAAVEDLLKRSEGSFLYVDRIREELSAGRLALANLDAFPYGLGGVYDAFFRRRFPDEEEYKGRFRDVISVVVAAREPLSRDDLTEMFHWSVYEREEIPEALGSLFPCVEDTLRPFHRTVVDWITNKSLSGPYFVRSVAGHGILADFGWQEYQSGIDFMSLY